jgi:hydroxylamine reductase
MFCYQCEQVAKGGACTIGGTCGKSADVAGLQDLLIYALKGLSHYAVEGRKNGINDREVNTLQSRRFFPRSPM